MYIEPNTNIKLLKNVPLDASYVNTYFVITPSSQASFFMAFVKHPLTNQTYQRVNKGVARVGIKAEDLYDCNYMMFQNTNFGNKWFYAFITRVEYVNNAVSEIYFEIDVMQTWFFDYELRDSFIQREHSVTDDIGDNIVAENVETGEYVYSGYSHLSNLMNEMVVLIAIVDTKEAVNGNVYDGVYSGTKLFAYNSSDVVNINKMLSYYIDSPDSVLSMYLAPKLLMPNVEVGGYTVPFKSSGSSLVVENGALSGTEDFGGYVPKNKKLYTYPFNYYHLDNANGTSLSLRYEFFDNLKPIIKIDGCITSPVKLVARPCSYKGMSPYDELAGYSPLNNEALVLEGYPLCSWNTDSYKAWVAQNNIPMMANIVKNVATGNALGVVNDVAGALTQQYTASIKADICKGNISSGNVNVANNRQQFYNARVHITAEFAKIIDMYFHMYGYATNKVKVPNRNRRSRWNYVKTLGCNAFGSVPSDDMVKIKSIYDKGITFWHTGSVVGKYTDEDGNLLDNNV